MKLISMTDFVFMVGNDENHVSYEKDLAKIYDYANFLKQPLKLEMFVPCDDEGNVLEEPKYVSPDGVKWDDFVKQYQQAKEKVLFEGFTLEINLGKVWILKKNDWEYNIQKDWTIENLVYKDFTLTQSAQKQLGL